MNCFVIYTYIGKRDCVGQDLAVRGLYVIFAMLILKYKFNIPAKYKTKEEYLNDIPTMFEDVNTPQIGVSVTLRENFGQTTIKGAINGNTIEK